MMRSKITRACQRGVTLIELMISITIGVVLLGAILAVYSATSSAGRQSETATRMGEDAAVAMNYMASYIRMAGYSMPKVIVPENTVSLGSGTGAKSDSNFDVNSAPLIGCDGGFSNPTVSLTTSLTCNSGTATAAIAVRFEGDVYNTGPSGANPTDCLGQAVLPTEPSAYSGAPNYSLVETRFFVRTGTNSGVPELFCAGNGAAAFAPQPIMQYVESLAINYGVADDGSSRVVTSYLTAAGVNALPDGDVDKRWRRVISVKICLVMRSETPDQNATGSYINCAGNAVASPDRYARRAFRSIVTLRNRGDIKP